MVQPDGRYYADDGFGREDDEEVTLCTLPDQRGRFAAPFSPHRIPEGFSD